MDDAGYSDLEEGTGYLRGMGVDIYYRDQDWDKAANGRF